MIRYLLIPSLLFVAACAKPEIEVPPHVEVRTVEVPRPAPVVPTVDQLRLRNVEWIIVTPENIEEVLSNINGEKVLFAVTAEGYENLSLNLSDVRSMIEQQQRIIVIYQNQFSS